MTKSRSESRSKNTFKNLMYWKIFEIELTRNWISTLSSCSFSKSPSSLCFKFSCSSNCLAASALSLQVQQWSISQIDSCFSQSIPSSFRTTTLYFLMIDLLTNSTSICHAEMNQIRLSKFYELWTKNKQQKKLGGKSDWVKNLIKVIPLRMPVLSKFYTIKL